jgi:signal transduction histidine kinase
MAISNSASEAQEWVAKRFWRADQRRSDSAGLGLSIVQRIIQVHRGRFEIASEPGHGAVFRLFFPRS